MAIVHINGFGTIPVSGDYVVPINATSGTSTLTQQAGRNGGLALRHRNGTTNATNGYVARLALPILSEFAVGVAINHRAAWVPSSRTFGFEILHNNGNNTDIQLGTGSSNVYQAASGTDAWTVSDATATGVGWHWWVWMFKWDGSVGLHRVYRDGILLAQQGTDTVPTAGAIQSGVNISLGNDNGGAQADFADLIVRNDATYIPDTVVISLFPDGTSAAGLVGSDGDSVNNHLLVNENPTYSAANYVGSATVGATDTYTMSGLPAMVGTVSAVQASTRAFKNDAGVKTMATLINSTQGTAVDPGGGATVYQVTTTDGGTAWDTTRVNAATLGVKVVS